MEVAEPKILAPSHSMDFGNGFYATTDFDQARKWSLVKKDRFHYEKAVVSTFELMAWKYVDQICFHTEKALNHLRFIKAEEVS
ncbi:DUF3990 domain-containing protein [Treponema sp.]|uniref:DUF3990 domain-containing protein n=1 Tax=Treponema sp. TaxID=166 RepID=UPI0025FE8F41|nr:DUF3990 domain-containing protein [Treponema sp.]